MTRLRHVDPMARRGAVWRLYVRLIGSAAGRWLSPRFVWRVDPPLIRWTRGRLGLGVMLPTALLETTGARTGRPRRNGVIYFNDGADAIVIASRLGAPPHPSW